MWVWYKILVLPIEIHTDACKLPIASILLLIRIGGSLSSVLYFSCVTSQKKKCFSQRYYEVLESVLCKNVRVITDCSAVRDTMTNVILLHALPTGDFQFETLKLPLTIL